MQLSEGLLLVGYIPLKRGVIGVNYTREVHSHIKAKGPCVSLNKNPKAQVSHTKMLFNRSAIARAVTMLQ